VIPLTPQARRYIDAAIHMPVNRQYESDNWARILEQDSASAARVILAILANMSVHIDNELRKADELSREQKIILSNDQWYVEDLMEEILESLPH
jgi:hypothetical protein